MENSSREVEVIGVPLDLGANMRGAIMGPASIRIAELHKKIRDIGFTPVDHGDLEVPVRETISATSAEQRYRPEIKTTCETLAGRVEAALDANRHPLVLGGDHCIAIGSISGAAQHFRKRQEKLGLIWVDAHADMNTPDSSPSGNIHGMPLAALLGQGHDDLVNLLGFKDKIAPENVALIGIRTLDGEEKRIVKESGIQYFTMRDIDEQGMATVMKKSIAAATNGTAGIHVSFDLDGVDPLYTPGVSTPVTGGISIREAHLIMEMVADTGKFTSLDMVELNPLRDRSQMTANAAVELIQSALGKSIL